MRDLARAGRADFGPMTDVPPPGPQSQGDSPQRAPSNGMGTAALVLGILALLLSVFFFPLGLLLGIAAIVGGFLGRRRVQQGLATNGGVSIAGLVLGIVAVVIAVLLGIFLIANSEDIENLQDCNRAADNDAELEDCAERFQEDLGG